jgi:hypothetical protein
MGLRDLFKEKPEVQEERERQEQHQRQEKELDAVLGRVKFFPGSQTEYETHVGYQVKIIDTGSRNMGIRFGMTNEDSDYGLHGNFDFKKKLVDEGIEAVINCNYSLGGNNLRYYHRIYGLPVAKK